MLWFEGSGLGWDHLKVQFQHKFALWSQAAELLCERRSQGCELGEQGLYLTLLLSAVCWQTDPNVLWSSSKFFSLFY